MEHNPYFHDLVYSQSDLDHNLNGLKYKIRQFLAHELQEIELSLNRPAEPNIDMALNRVKNIRKFLDRL